ncbi:MAG TPA: hypothetical protein VJ453_04445 [Terriglobales bacterium]|nr:hypothetical protein [Terriglobales bacterium]
MELEEGEVEEEGDDALWLLELLEEDGYELCELLELDGLVLLCELLEADGDELDGEDAPWSDCGSDEELEPLLVDGVVLDPVWLDDPV